MKLSEILRNIPCTINGEDKEIRTIEYDSRRVKEGALFVAVRGYQTDGHLYIDKAIENGAAAILCEEYQGKADIPIVFTGDTRMGLSAAAANFYGNSASRLKIIGVTGTNGKTTVTYLIKKVLDLVGIKTGLIGTNQNMIGDEVIETGRTTPESADLHKLLKTMEESGVTHVVMEVSSHALALSRVFGIKFETGIFTNLTQDHLDFHNTMEEYCDTKSKLFAQSKKGCVNTDDMWGKVIAKKAVAPIMSYAVNDDADIKAENIKLSERSVKFTIKYNGEEHEIRLGIPGYFSVYNALSAICACLSIGIDIEDIKKGLILAQGVKGRAEVVPLPAKYTVMIDYAHTPDGLENIIKTVKGYAKSRTITVFGCGGDRDRTKRPKMGKVAGELSDFCIVTSDNPRSEEPWMIVKDILEGMVGLEGKFDVVVDRTQAIETAMRMANDGDVIILAGKGHETYQILKDRTIDYDERVIVKEIFQKITE